MTGMEFVGLCDKCRKSGVRVIVADGLTVCPDCFVEGKA